MAGSSKFAAGSAGSAAAEGNGVSRPSRSRGPHRKLQAVTSSLQGVRQEGDAAPGEGSPASAEAPTSSLPGGLECDAEESRVQLCARARTRPTQAAHAPPARVTCACLHPRS